MSKKSRPRSYQERRRRKTVRRARDIVRIRATVRDIGDRLRSALRELRQTEAPDRILTWVPTPLQQDLANAVNMPASRPFGL
jgi:hypothetical protein